MLGAKSNEHESRRTDKSNFALTTGGIVKKGPFYVVHSCSLNRLPPWFLISLMIYPVGFGSHFQRDRIQEMCKTLRVLNAVRNQEIGIPLSIHQYKVLQCLVSYFFSLLGAKCSILKVCDIIELILEMFSPRSCLHHQFWFVDWLMPINTFLGWGYRSTSVWTKWVGFSITYIIALWFHFRF